MIEEDLYKKASDELNSDQRKSDIWARACALASDDHDEARYLYTNLRVEQMREDGASSNLQHVATATPAKNGVGSPLLELDDENAATGPVWRSIEKASEVKTTDSAVAIDDLLDLDDNETIDTGVSMASEVEPAPITLSAKADTSTNAVNLFNAEASVLAPSEEPQTSPEEPKAEALSNDLKRQVGAIESVRADYDDTDNVNGHTGNSVTLSELESGPGQPYLVFGRSGATKAIKQGVSWPALFITLPWLLSRQLIGTAIVYTLLWCVVVAGLLFTGFAWMDSTAAVTSADSRLWVLAFGLLALVGLFFVPFIYGNNWVANKLLKRGYELKSVVKARNPQDAITRLIRYAS